MATISIRIPEEDLTILKAYAKLNNKSLSEMIRQTMLERIEDEFDKEVFATYEEEKDSIATRPINQLWKELDL